jgi:uncharacterized membrane protein YhhN
VDSTLLAFGFFAVTNWIAAATDARRLEYLAKPATLATLAWWAYARHAPAPLVLGLVCSLAGDVFLMLPVDLFAAGLGSFLAAHVCYLVALAVPGDQRIFWTLGLLIATAPLGRHILRAVPGTPLRAACVVYLLALVAMTGSALAAGPLITAVGGLLFLASDTLLAWNRFVRPWRWAHTLVMITYHLGQLGLAWGLAAG